MSSTINTSFPQTGNASTANVRANFTAAKNEIEALQEGLYGGVNTLTGDTTLTSTSSGKFYENTGASGTVIITLPAATAGLKYAALRVATQSFEFEPAAGEKFRGGSADNHLKIGADGDLVQVQCFIAGVWDIVYGIASDGTIPTITFGA